jgi:hypothetical protein
MNCTTAKKKRVESAGAWSYLVLDLGVARRLERHREGAVLVNGVALDGAGEQAHRQAVLLQLLHHGISPGHRSHRHQSRQQRQERGAQTGTLHRTRRNVGERS